MIKKIVGVTLLLTPGIIGLVAFAVRCGFLVALVAVLTVLATLGLMALGARLLLK